MQKAKVIDSLPFLVLSVSEPKDGKNAAGKVTKGNIYLTVKGQLSIKDPMRTYTLTLSSKQQKSLELQYKITSFKGFEGKAFMFPIEERIAGVTGRIETVDGKESIIYDTESSVYPTVFANWNLTVNGDYQSALELERSEYAKARISIEMEAARLESYVSISKRFSGDKAKELEDALRIGQSLKQLI